MHPVTWKALCKPVPCCRHEQQLQKDLSCLSCTKAGTSPVPRRARLASLHSWEKEIFVYCPGSGGQAAHHPVVPCSPALPPGLACLATSWGFLGPLPQTGDSYPHIWGSGLFSSIKLLLGLGVVPPSAAQMPRPMGAHLQCPYGSVPFPFLWGLPKKIPFPQCLGKSNACMASPIAGFWP